MLILEAAKQATTLERYGFWGNIVAGIGAAVAAIASLWSIRSAIKERKEERKRAKPLIQFGSMNIFSPQDDHHSAVFMFSLFNVKRVPLQNIEYSVFVIDPENKENDSSDYEYRYLSGLVERQFEIVCPCLSMPKTNSKIVIMLKTADVYGNIGCDNFTLLYEKAGYVPTAEALNLDFCRLSHTGVYLDPGTAGSDLQGSVALMTRVYQPVISRIIEVLQRPHDDAIEKMINDKRLKRSLVLYRSSKRLTSCVSQIRNSFHWVIKKHKLWRRKAKSGVPE